ARVEPQLRAEAFARLVDFYGYAKARDLVPAALEQPIRLLRRAAAVAAGDAHDLEQVERLCRSLREEPAWLIEAVVTALDKLGDARAEGPSGVVSIAAEGGELSVPDRVKE